MNNEDMLLTANGDYALWMRAATSFYSRFFITDASGETVGRYKERNNAERGLKYHANK